MEKIRLDVLLKQNGMFESREKARTAILSRQVFVGGVNVNDPAKKFDPEHIGEIKIDADANKYVSRGAYKLECAIENFHLEVKGKIATDIGSSTGGFSDVLLQNGIEKIYCIDTGRDQLHPKIRNSGKVEVYEETDFRTIDAELVRDSDIVVIDVSFISIESIVEKLQQVFHGKHVQVVSLIKPQFECGKEIAKKYKGVIKDKKVHADVIHRVLGFWTKCGFNIDGVVKSPIKGGDGNIEYLLLTDNYSHTTGKIDIDSLVTNAFDEK